MKWFLVVVLCESFVCTSARVVDDYETFERCSDAVMGMELESGEAALCLRENGKLDEQQTSAY